jgi:hypothetical protein
MPVWRFATPGKERHAALDPVYIMGEWREDKLGFGRIRSLSRRDVAIVAWHEVPGKASLEGTVRINENNSKTF